MKKKNKEKISKEDSATRYIIDLLEAVAEKVGVKLE